MDIIRRDTVRHYRHIRKILKGNEYITLPDELQESKTHLFSGSMLGLCMIVALIVILLGMLQGCACAKEIHLKASWYSTASLKKEGTYKHSKGVMANGHIFNDKLNTCATRLFPLGVVLWVSNMQSGEYVMVKVTDRIGKRFGKTRIDLSKAAFMQIADLNQGLINVEVERIK